MALFLTYKTTNKVFNFHFKIFLKIAINNQRSIQKHSTFQS